MIGPQGQSEFDRFLLTQLQETDGVPLTVLSMLARQDLEPIEEALRLSQLPYNEAVNSLALKLWKSDSTQWSPSDASILAAQLIALLPKEREAESPVTIVARYEGQLMMWLMYGIVLGTLVFNGTSQRSDPTGGSPPAATMSSQDPSSSHPIK
jgi:hypothetical protein